MQSLLKKQVATRASNIAVHTAARRPWTLAEGGVTLRGNHARHASSKPLLNATTVAADDSRRQLAGVLGTLVGLSVVVCGAEGAAASDVVTELSNGQDRMQVGAVAQPAQQSTFELSTAPDLVTDMDVEASASPFSVETALATGIGWVVEEGLEVTNFSESNFAAVGAPSSSMWLSNSPWCLVWDAYCNVLNTQPVATKLATGMVGTFLGDMLAQSMQGLVRSTSSAVSGRTIGSRRGQVGGSSEAAVTADVRLALDVGRTSRLVGFSALVGTPVAFVWFGLLDQFVLPSDPTNPLAVFTKVALDQVCMAPCMTSVFFAAMAWLEGCREREQLLQTVKAKLKPTLLANWTVWPLAHVINFALVPPAQRILYINVINIAWTAFMSHMAADSSNPDCAGTKMMQQPQQARR